MNYRVIAAKSAREHGIDPGIFLAQIGQESGFNPTAKSGAGAIGIAQIVPKFHPGVDPNDPIASLDYAAKWMSQLYKKYGNYEQALSVYNSGKPDAYLNKGFSGGQTYNYVKKILAAAKRGGSAPSASPGLPGLPGLPSPVPSSGIDLTQTVLMNLGIQNPMERLKNLTNAVAQGTMEPEPMHPGSAAGSTVPTTQPVGPWKNWVKLSPSADRSGVKTQTAVLKFVGNLAHTFGKPLTIGTGTNHSQMTVNGNVSDHWRGMAADIPASGATLKQLGYAALRQAGMSETAARRAARTGGLFNVGPYQIIFATSQGGNHWGHLHIGL